MTYSGTATGNTGCPFGAELGVPVLVASGVHVSMKDCDGIAFCTYEDGGAQAIAFKESIDGASEQVLPVFTQFLANDGLGTVVTRESQAADDAWAKADTTAFDALYTWVLAEHLSPGFNAVECTIDGAGICVAIPFRLHTQRAPENLPALNVT